METEQKAKAISASDRRDLREAIWRFMEMNVPLSVPVYDESKRITETIVRRVEELKAKG